MKRNMLLVLGLCIFLQVNSKSSFDGVRKYRGKEITSQNIIELIGKVPSDAVSAVYNFLSNYPAPSKYFENTLSSVSAQNELHVRQLLMSIDIAEQVVNNPDDWDKSVQGNSQLLEDKIRDDKLSMTIMCLENMARNNYVFMCPESQGEWIVKIASPGNRLVNLYTSAGFNVYTQKLINENVQQDLNLKNKSTYQTVSFAQVSLMLQELVDSEQFNYICAPKTYLYRLMDMNVDEENNNESNYKEVNDSNCFVVQEFVPGIKHLHDNQDLILDTSLITVEMVKELRACIEYAWLWNIKHNLAICMDENSVHYKKLVLFDTEQRNLTSPEEFSKVTPDWHQKIMNVGLKEARDLFRDRQDLLKVLED